MIPRLSRMLLAALLVACAGESADTAIRADTATDTSTSNVTAEDCTAEQVKVMAGRLQRGWRPHDPETLPDSADTATRADTAADTSTSNVTGEDCMAEQVKVMAGRLQRGWRPHDPETVPDVARHAFDRLHRRFRRHRDARGHGH